MNAPTLMDASLRPTFEDILYREAWLLDNLQLDEWMAQLHPDIRYWAPVRSDLEREQEDFAEPFLMCHFDEDRDALETRVKRIQMGLGYVDQPRARIRHLVTNVLVLESAPGQAKVTSNFMVFRSHVGLPDHFITGCRNDDWVDEGAGWKLKERQILIDKTTIEGLAVLF
jgi:3-phenylpropionate/cinnamic acid dioxygenase small subunit